MTACDDRRGDLGAHVLGALEPEEATDIERHLAACDGCAAEYAELAGLPDLLALVPADLAGDDPAEPDGSFADRLAARAADGAEPDGSFADRLAARAADRQRARRRRWLSVAAACLVVAGGAGAAASTLTGGTSSIDRLSATDTATGVSTLITLERRPSGTAITLRISGVPDGADCTLFAVARDGRRDVAGSWHASYTGTASMQGSTAIPEAQLTRLVVDTTSGQQLISVPVPR